MSHVSGGRALRVLLLAFCFSGVASAQSGALRVGAARVDVTPADAPAASVRDRLYVRAIVIDNGATRSVLVSADQGGVNEAAWATASKQVAAELAIPVENILISATHTHSGAGQPGVPAAIVEAVRQARTRLRPALMGFGRGNAYVNVNRDAIHPTTRLWYQGPNLEGVSDKTVSVVSFWTPENVPIAAYYSYAMHPINFYQSGLISADFPGEAARHMEQVLGSDFVALFVQAPSGDQNPLYSYISSPVAAPEIPRAQGDTTSRALRVGANETVVAEGVMLGREVLRVMFTTTARSSEARIRGAQKMVTCPGRTRLDNARQGVPGQYEDGPDVNIRVGLLRIGDVAMATINGEVYTEIGLRLRRESPLANLMPISLTNGSAGSGYIPNDASFNRYTFQVLGSRLKPGCAEGGIAGAVLDLTRQTN